jgi:hypothetical protein
MKNKLIIIATLILFGATLKGQSSIDSVTKTNSNKYNNSFSLHYHTLKSYSPLMCSLRNNSIYNNDQGLFGLHQMQDSLRFESFKYQFTQYLPFDKYVQSTIYPGHLDHFRKGNFSSTGFTISTSKK